MRVLLIIVVITTLILNCHSLKWLIPSTLEKVSNSSRYKEIYFPSKDLFILQGRIEQENILISPKTFFPILKDAFRFCADTKIALAKDAPEIFNNTLVTNPCEMYFCSKTPHSFIPHNDTHGYMENFADAYSNKHFVHAMAHNWCTKCEETIDQGFDEFVKTNNCPWFDSKLCDDWCPVDVPCIYFHTRHSVCYKEDQYSDQYFVKINDLNVGFMKLRVWGLSFVYLAVNVVIFIVNVLCVVLPEIGALKRRFTGSDLTGLEKLQNIFSLRNQATIIAVAVNLIFIVTSFLDIINFVVPILSGIFALYIHFGSLPYIFALLCILWVHIYNQTETLGVERRLSTTLRIVWFVVTILGLSIAGVAVILLVVQQILLAKLLSPFVVQVMLFSFILFICGLLLIVSVSLVIMSLVLLIRMERPKDVTHFGMYYFKLKLTRCIFLFNLILIPGLLSAIMTACGQIWPDIMTFNWGIGIQPLLNCVLGCAFTIHCCYTLIHVGNFKLFYKCGKK